MGFCPYIYYVIIKCYNFQTSANTTFLNTLVRVGTHAIPPTSWIINANSICSSKQSGAQDYSGIVFECPAPGIMGNTVSIQSFQSNVTIYEIEILGKIFLVQSNTTLLESDLLHSSCSLIIKIKK